MERPCSDSAERQGALNFGGTAINDSLRKYFRFLNLKSSGSYFILSDLKALEGQGIKAVLRNPTVLLANRFNISSRTNSNSFFFFSQLDLVTFCRWPHARQPPARI